MSLCAHPLRIQRMLLTLTETRRSIPRRIPPLIVERRHRGPTEPALARAIDVHSDVVPRSSVFCMPMMGGTRRKKQIQRRKETICPHVGQDC